MKRTIVGIVLMIIALAYVAGFWPEHRRLSAARTEIRTLHDRLSSADDRMRASEVLGQLMRLTDAVAARNYGDAATLSSSYFDTVRAEASRTGHPALKGALENILRTRDRVTTAIAQTDRTLAGTLKDQERTLRRALGYPVSSGQS